MPSDQVYTEKSISAKLCSVYEFGNDSFAEEFLKTWITDTYQFDVFCPDLRQYDYSLYNKKGAMKANSLIFRVEKCVDPVDQPGFCKDDEVI